MEYSNQTRGGSLNIEHSSLRNYIFWSTLLGMFSAAVAVRRSFTVRAFDGIMLINFCLMIPLANLRRIRIPVWIPCFILYLAASGFVGIVRGTDTGAQVTKEFLGISTSVLYYFCFFKIIDNDFERAFFAYAKIAFWFAVIAFPIWLGSCISQHGFERLRGLEPEPTTFCQVVLPAYYWYGYHYIKSRKHGTEVAVLTLALILTNSSNGYLSVAFGVILLMSGRLKHLIAIPLVAGGLLGLAYASSANVKTRVDDTFFALATQDVGGSNLSTYALISNLFVTQQVLKESPVIGNGLGSNPISHNRYIGNVSGIERFLETGAEGLNAPDASSLALRTLSELGILGFSGIAIFLYRFYVGGPGSRAAISNALLVYYFLKLLRSPLYFDPELFFFIFVYILNRRHYAHEVRPAVLLRGRQCSPVSMRLATKTGI